VEISYTVPDCDDFDNYRARSFTSSCVGPYSWRNARHRPLTSADAVIETVVACGNAVITARMIDKFANDNGIFLVGQSVRRLRSAISDTLVVIPRNVLATHPREGFDRVVLIRTGISPTLDKLLPSAIYHNAGNVPYYVLFVKKGEVIPASPSAPPLRESRIDLAQIVAVLKGGAHTMPALCKKLGCSRKEINWLLASRRDIFIHKSGDKPTWSLVETWVDGGW